MFSESRYRVHVCLGPNCVPNGGKRTLVAFETAIADRGLGAEIELIATSCRDRCELGPSVNVYPGAVFYGHVDENAAVRIVDEHLANDRAVADLVVAASPHEQTGRR